MLRRRIIKCPKNPVGTIGTLKHLPNSSIKINKYLIVKKNKQKQKLKLKTNIEKGRLVAITDQTVAALRKVG